MTDILENELSSDHEDSIDGIVNQIKNNNNNNNNEHSRIPSVIVESTIPTRKDSIVIPSISNGSISSTHRIDENTLSTNNTLLPVCTSNSLGDLSSTPLLLLDNPVSTSPGPPVNERVEPTEAATFIQCRSFPLSSSSSSSSSDQSCETPIIHELLKADEEIEAPAPPATKKAPAPPPPVPAPVESVPAKRTVSQSAGEEIYYSPVQNVVEPRRSLNRQTHQRHGSADVLYRHPINHEYLNRSSTSSSAFYPSETLVSHPINYYDYDQNLTYIQQIEQELRQTKEQLEATMKSIKTFWSPELKKERTLRKEESCRYQLLINEHQKRGKQDTQIQTLEHQLRQMREELEKSRHQQHVPVSFAAHVEHSSTNDTHLHLQRQNQELKDKLEQRIGDLHGKENECVTLKAKVDTYESKEKDLQHYISILKESILIKDQQVNMIQSEIADLRARLKEKDSVIDKKNSKIQSTRLDRQQREYDLQESKQQLDIRDRKINVLNRKIDNLEEQLKEKSTQIALTRAKLTAVTTTAAAVSVPQQTSVTTTTLVSNLETTIGEKERAIEKLREQKHTLEIEHQEELDQVQRILQETRTKLEQKEKDYYEGQNQIIELREQLNNSKSLLQRREAHIQTLEQQIGLLKSTTTMPTKSDFPERAKLENENRTLQDRLSCFELERNEMQREIEWMQQELEQPKVSPPLPAGPTDSAEHDESFLLKKQQRIEELEHAVRESLQITTEREYAMTQQKRKMENLEKQIKTLQNEVEHLRGETHEQSQLVSQLKSELNERKRQYEQRLEDQIKQLDNAFISQQEKILGELSEKDSYIADLEMDRHNSGAANRAMIIERLNNEKQQLHNQLKELTEIRTKIIQDHLAAKEEYEQREKSLASSSVIDSDGDFC